MYGYRPFDDHRNIFVEFEKSLEGFDEPTELVLPVTYLAKRDIPSSRSGRAGSSIFQTALVAENRVAYYRNEVDVSRLNIIHKHLWIAGLERPARPLTEQSVLGRQIVVTEQTDLHLLWISGRIFVKPLPDFLLCASVWDEYICRDAQLYEQSLGLLLSYVWLISHKNDFRIAQSHGLISESISWKSWNGLVTSMASRMDFNKRDKVNIRYRFGELRLNRVNWAYRFCSRTRSPTNLLRGYKYGYYYYESFLEKNLKWLVSITVYVSLVLAAMQVGLDTDYLGQSVQFQNASYGFSVVAILAPVSIITTVLLVVGVLVLFNLNYTLKHMLDWSFTDAINDSTH